MKQTHERVLVDFCSASFTATELKNDMKVAYGVFSRVIHGLSSLESQRKRGIAHINPFNAVLINISWLNIARLKQLGH